MKEEMICEIDYLLDEAGDKVWNRAEKIMVELYWDVGFCLRDYKEKEIFEVSKELGKVLDVEEKFFEIAFHFYKSNPIKKRALEVAK